MITYLRYFPPSAAIFSMNHWQASRHSLNSNFMCETHTSWSPLWNRKRGKFSSLIQLSSYQKKTLCYSKSGGKAEYLCSHLVYLIVKKIPEISLGSEVGVEKKVSC